VREGCEVFEGSSTLGILETSYNKIGGNYGKDK